MWKQNRIKSKTKALTEIDPKTHVQKIHITTTITRKIQVDIKGVCYKRFATPLRLMTPTILLCITVLLLLFVYLLGIRLFYTTAERPVWTEIQLKTVDRISDVTLWNRSDDIFSEPRWLLKDQLLRAPLKLLMILIWYRFFYQCSLPVSLWYLGLILLEQKNKEISHWRLISCYVNFNAINFDRK